MRESHRRESSAEEPNITPEGLKVEILWGDSSLIRVGRDAPITVRVTSSGAETSGTARVSVPISGGEYYVLEEALSVAAGETRQAILSVPVTYYTDMVEVEFQAEDGTVYASKTVNLRADYGDQEIYVAVISSDVGQLAAFDRVMLNEYRGTTTRLFDFKEETLPTDANVLKLYDVFLWDDVSLDAIGEKQMEALSSWVYGGGVLIVGPDSQWQDKIVPGEIRQENWGRGLYVYCGFSLRDVPSKYAGEDGIRSFLYEAVGETRMTEMEENIEDAYRDYWSGTSMTSGVDADRIPQIWQYGLVLVVYLLLLGPVLYAILKKKKRRNLLRGCMLGLALLFTAIIYGMGSRTRFYRPFMNYASVREIRSGVLMETVYASIMSPNNASYDFVIQPEYDVSPLLSYDYALSEKTDGHVCRLQIREEEEGTRVWIREDIPFTANMLCLTGTEASPYGEGFGGEITLFENGFEGVLRNATGQDFEQVCILSGGHVVLLGDMAAGAEVDLAQQETRLIYGSQQDTILKAIAGTDTYSAPGESAEASQATWRYRVLYSYFHNHMFNETGEALVIGFPAVENASYLTNSEMDVQGTTLVTETIALQDQKDGQRYQTMDEASIDVMQGSYHYMRNSTSEALCVLRYDFGELQVDRLIMQWPPEPDASEYMKAFLQGPEFYNWETDTYDRMELKKSYDRSELHPYLDEENRLTIRYAAEPGEDYYYEVFLPNLSVVGRVQG